MAAVFQTEINIRIFKSHCHIDLCYRASYIILAKRKENSQVRMCQDVDRSHICYGNREECGGLDASMDKLATE